MAGNKKPRKAHRPRSRILNAAEYAAESLQPLVEFDPDYVRAIKVRDHSAMTSMTQGTATQHEVEQLIATYNLAYAIWHTMTVPKFIANEWQAILTQANDSLTALRARAAQLQRVVCRGCEIQALNNLLDLSDNLLDVLNVRQFEIALTYARARATAPKKPQPQEATVA